MKPKIKIYSQPADTPASSLQGNIGEQRLPKVQEKQQATSQAMRELALAEELQREQYRADIEELERANEARLQVADASSREQMIKDIFGEEGTDDDDSSVRSTSYESEMEEEEMEEEEMEDEEMEDD